MGSGRAEPQKSTPLGWPTYWHGELGAHTNTLRIIAFVCEVRRQAVIPFSNPVTGAVLFYQSRPRLFCAELNNKVPRTMDINEPTAWIRREGDEIRRLRLPKRHPRATNWRRAKGRIGEHMAMAWLLSRGFTVEDMTQAPEGTQGRYGRFGRVDIRITLPNGRTLELDAKVCAENHKRPYDFGNDVVPIWYDWDRDRVTWNQPYDLEVVAACLPTDTGGLNK